MYKLKFLWVRFRKMTCFLFIGLPPKKRGFNEKVKHPCWIFGFYHDSFYCSCFLLLNQTPPKFPRYCLPDYSCCLSYFGANVYMFQMGCGYVHSKFSYYFCSKFSPPALHVHLLFSKAFRKLRKKNSQIYKWTLISSTKGRNELLYIRA